MLYPARLVQSCRVSAVQVKPVFEVFWTEQALPTFPFHPLAFSIFVRLIVAAPSGPGPEAGECLGGT